MSGPTSCTHQPNVNSSTAVSRHAAIIRSACDHIRYRGALAHEIQGRVINTRLLQKRRRYRSTYARQAKTSHVCADLIYLIARARSAFSSTDCIPNDCSMIDKSRAPIWHGSLRNCVKRLELYTAAAAAVHHVCTSIMLDFAGRPRRNRRYLMS